MNAKAAWQAGYTGKGILVAVVDDGVKIDHPDLKSNFVGPINSCWLLKWFVGDLAGSFLLLNFCYKDVRIMSRLMSAPFYWSMTTLSLPAQFISPVFLVAF